MIKPCSSRHISVVLLNSPNLSSYRCGSSSSSSEVACWRTLFLFFVHLNTTWFSGPFWFLGTLIQWWSQQLQPLLAQDVVKD